MNLINSVPQAAAKTFAFSFVFLYDTEGKIVSSIEQEKNIQMFGPITIGMRVAHL